MDRETYLAYPIDPSRTSNIASPQISLTTMGTIPIILQHQALLRICNEPRNGTQSPRPHDVSFVRTGQV